MIFVGACGEGDASFRWAQVCIADDPDPLGPACLQLISSEARYDTLSRQDQPPFDRSTKYMVPVERDATLLPPLLQNVNRYEQHRDFLALVFPDRFAALSVEEYQNLIFFRQTRRYFSGTFYRIKKATADNPPLYGFDVSTGVDQGDLLGLDEVRYIHELLTEVLPRAEVAYVVDDINPGAKERAKGWINPGFPIYFKQDGGELNWEVYTPGVAYGRVRLFTLEQFNAAVQQGRVSWQDIVVLDRVPFDIEGVVAAVVTGRRQWLLSHVNVRMARRGTPNLYVKEPLEAFKSYDGQLMRIEAVKGAAKTDLDYFKIEPADQAAAEAWWSAHRPKLSQVPQVDRSYRTLEHLLKLDVDDNPLPLVSQVGGKAANLAKLYSTLDRKYQVQGFAIPFAWFEDFIDQNTLLDTRSDPPKTVTYRQYINSLESDPRFRSDAPYRREHLRNFRESIEKVGKLDSELVRLLQSRIEQVFGSTKTKVRFRSSSNIEDALEFSGAGLYSSTSVCAADTLDSDLDGPSRCDPGQDEERSIERGLKRVWASLYNMRAWDERDWYQVPQDQASMAILVTRAFSDEIANGVAFTGNPANVEDKRFLVNAQLGDESVVGNDPLIIPEKDLLAVQDGQVVSIVRARASSLASSGEEVLDDAQLEELGKVMAQIDESYPLELGSYSREQVLLDLEFKIDGLDGGLKIKQIRSFLLPLQVGN